MVDGTSTNAEEVNRTPEQSCCAGPTEQVIRHLVGRAAEIVEDASAGHDQAGNPTHVLECDDPLADLYQRPERKSNEGRQCRKESTTSDDPNEIDVVINDNVLR
jgi:hypothetical protein